MLFIYKSFLKIHPQQGRYTTISKFVKTGSSKKFTVMWLRTKIRMKQIFFSLKIERERQTSKQQTSVRKRLNESTPAQRRRHWKQHMKKKRITSKCCCFAAVCRFDFFSFFFFFLSVCDLAVLLFWRVCLLSLFWIVLLMPGICRIIELRVWVTYERLLVCFFILWTRWIEVFSIEI